MIFPISVVLLVIDVSLVKTSLSSRTARVSGIPFELKRYEYVKKILSTCKVIDFLFIIQIFSQLFSLTYLFRPNAIGFPIESHAHISVVGVDVSRVSIDVPLLVQPTTSADVLAASADPFGCWLHKSETTKFPVVGDGDDLLLRSPSIWVAFRSVLAEVLPTLSAVALPSLAHKLVPRLALIVWRVSFHKPPRRWAARRSFLWYVQFHISIFYSS